MLMDMQVKMMLRRKKMMLRMRTWVGLSLCRTDKHLPKYGQLHESTDSPSFTILNWQIRNITKKMVI